VDKVRGRGVAVKINAKTAGLAKAQIVLSRFAPRKATSIVPL
jgi:hypothetical protein